MRAAIQDLRQRYENLLKENSQDIVEQQLAKSEMVIDPELIEMVETEADHKCVEVEKEMAWELEKRGVLLNKLKKRFLDDIAIENIRIHALRSGVWVETFRTKHLSEFLQESMQELRAMLEAQEQAKLATLGTTHSQLDEEVENSEIGTGRDPGQYVVHSDLSGLSTQEARRILRKQRKKELEWLESQKPAEDQDDPRDIAAIEEAKRTMGDYKLKSAVSFRYLKPFVFQIHNHFTYGGM